MRRIAAVVLVTGFMATVGAGSARAGELFNAANYNWSGFYLGGQLGGGTSSLKGTFTEAPGGLDFGGSGQTLAGGGFVGFQHGFGPLVLGVEGDFTALSDNVTGTCLPQSRCAPGSRTAGRIDDIWSVGPRLGWNAGRWMPYATGGYASASVENNASSPGFFTSSSDRVAGWYVGGGIDLALTGNWKLGVEYRHYDFSDETVTPTARGAPDLLDRWTLDPLVDTLTARLTYVFGQREDPVPLK